MSAEQILAALTTSEETVLKTLKEVADILCDCHTHNLAALDNNPGEVVELYCLAIDCGEGDIIWQVEMWPNCHFKSIKRCKRVTIPNSESSIRANALRFALKPRAGTNSRV